MRNGANWRPLYKRQLGRRQDSQFSAALGQDRQGKDAVDEFRIVGQQARFGYRGVSVIQLRSIANTLRKSGNDSSTRPMFTSATAISKGRVFFGLYETKG